MKMKLLVPTFLLCIFFTQIVYSQVDEQTINAHKDDVESYRSDKNEQMLKAESSPLSQDQIDSFNGLSYYPIDIKYKIEAEFTIDEQQKKVSLTTTSDGEIKLVKYGTVTFNYEGKSISLTVYQNNNLPEFADSKQLFIPFTDLTTEKETNNGGRYLAVEMPQEGNTMILDFNKAMNPYNAYDSSYASVIPPVENSFQQFMATGERKYEDRTN